jgi:hypothetical protein
MLFPINSVKVWKVWLRTTLEIDSFRDGGSNIQRAGSGGPSQNFVPGNSRSSKMPSNSSKID